MVISKRKYTICPVRDSTLLTVGEAQRNLWKGNASLPPSPAGTMKLKIFLFFLLLASSAGSLIQAQETIVDALKTPFMNEGLVEIDVDPAITALFGKPGFNTKTDSASYDMIKVNGFRILAFMGNDQKKSRTEAFDRQNRIKAVFSDMETYISYDAPNWRVLIGDFVTREEATFFQETLQKEFPQFGKEMYIITDKVNVPIAKTN